MDTGLVELVLLRCRGLTVQVRERLMLGEGVLGRLSRGRREGEVVVTVMVWVLEWDWEFCRREDGEE